MNGRADASGFGTDRRPFSVGPGGRPVLWRRPLPGGRWRLGVAGEEGDSAPGPEIECESRPVAVGWRRDRRAIAFLQLLPERCFGLVAWEFGEGAAPRLLPAPRITSGFQTLRWHRERFEILCRAGGSLVGVRRDGHRIYATGILPGSGFLWHPDGERVGCVSSLAPGAILEVGPAKRSFRLRRVVPRGKVGAWAWLDGKGGVAAAARANGGEWSGIWLLGSEGSADSAGPRFPGDGADAAAPAVCRGGRLAWEIHRHGASSVRLPDGRVLADAAIVDEAMEDIGSTLVLRRRPTDRPPELWRWTEEEGLGFLAARATRTPSAVPTPEHVWIGSPETERTPGWLWWPENPVGAVLEVHGGPRLAEGPGWHPARDSLLRNGVAVLCLNYSGSSGYGSSREKRFDRDLAVGEVRRAARWLSDRLPAEGAKVVLSGHCFGAGLVLEAARPPPEGVGCPVVVASPKAKSLQRWVDAAKTRRALLKSAVFGAWDPFFPAGELDLAWAALETVGEVRRIKIPAEGHCVRHPESLQTYNRALLEALAIRPT